MKSFYVLLYRPDWDRKVLDNIISDYTLMVNILSRAWRIWEIHRILKILWLLRCGHAEILTLEDGGKCWTSTMQGTEKGCVVRPAPQVLHTARRWYGWKVTVKDYLYDQMIRWMQHTCENNPGYAWGSEIPSFFLPIRVDGKGMICSGFTKEAEIHAGLFQTNKSISVPFTNAKLTFDIWSPLLLSYNHYLLMKKDPSMVKGPFYLKDGKTLEFEKSPSLK